MFVHVLCYLVEQVLKQQPFFFSFIYLFIYLFYGGSSQITVFHIFVFRFHSLTESSCPPCHCCFFHSIQIDGIPLWILREWVTAINRFFFACRSVMWHKQIWETPPCIWDCRGWSGRRSRHLLSCVRELQPAGGLKSSVTCPYVWQSACHTFDMLYWGGGALPVLEAPTLSQQHSSATMLNTPNKNAVISPLFALKTIQWI